MSTIEIEKINNHFLTTNEIQEFEKTYNLSLPRDYKEFLLKYNGGEPYPNVFSIEPDKIETDVQLFYALIDKKQPSLTIDYIYKLYQDRLPQDLIPIATDSGGNIICIEVKQESYGKIYYWDIEKETEDDKNHTKNNFYEISDCFSNFLDSLYELEL